MTTKTLYLNRINLNEYKSWVYKLIRYTQVGEEEHEDMFQDFAIYFYNNYNYNGETKPITFITMSFRGFLSDKSKYDNAQCRTGIEIHLEEKDALFLDRIQEENSIANNSLDDEVYCSEILEGASDGLKRFLFEDRKWGKGSIVEEEATASNKTRNSVSIKYNKELKKLLESRDERVD